MRLNVNLELKNLDGTTLKEGDNKIWTVGEVLKMASLCSPANSQNPYSSDEQVMRFQFAFAVYTAETAFKNGFLEENNITVDVTAELAAKLKTDIARLFGPLVGGQIIPLLDGR